MMNTPDFPPSLHLLPSQGLPSAIPTSQFLLSTFFGMLLLSARPSEAMALTMGACQLLMLCRPTQPSPEVSQKSPTYTSPQEAGALL